MSPRRRPSPIVGDPKVWGAAACVALAAACGEAPRPDLPASASPPSSPAPRTDAVAAPVSSPPGSSGRGSAAPSPSPSTLAAPAVASVVAPPASPAAIVVPASVKSAAKARPFLLVLHGFSGSGAAFAKHVGLAALAERRGFSYAAPDGTLDRSGRRHWNAGPACCDFDGLGTDHVAALTAVLEAARRDPHVDPSRVFVAGVSNGGFMSERLACDVPGIAGVLDVAGSAPLDLATCKAPPIGAYLHVHGQDDPTVRIGGGRVLGRTDVASHPASEDVVAAWARRAGCGSAVPAGTLDLEASIPDAETSRSRHQGCAGRFELLRVAGGGHDVASSPAAFESLVTLLLGDGS